MSEDANTIVERTQSSLPRAVPAVILLFYFLAITSRGCIEDSMHTSQVRALNLRQEFFLTSLQESIVSAQIDETRSFSRKVVDTKVRDTTVRNLETKLKILREDKTRLSEDAEKAEKELFQLSHTEARVTVGCIGLLIALSLVIISAAWSWRYMHIAILGVCALATGAFVMAFLS